MKLGVSARPLPKRILFLDIDGVLNSHRTHYVWGAGFLIPNLTITDFDAKLDPVAVGLLRKVVVAFDFDIVLSSSWRVGASFKESKHFFTTVMRDQYGWDNFPIIDQTPVFDAHSVPRGQEINAWFKDNMTDLDDYIILDDDNDMLDFQREHFFRVNPHIGLSFDFVEWAENRYGGMVSRHTL